MQCLDCPDLGDFEGRPEPRAVCCMDEHREREKAAAKRQALAEAEIAAMPSRQARRRAAAVARKSRT